MQPASAYHRNSLRDFSVSPMPAAATTTTTTITNTIITIIIIATIAEGIAGTHTERQSCQLRLRVAEFKRLLSGRRVHRRVRIRSALVSTVCTVCTPILTITAVLTQLCARAREIFALNLRAQFRTPDVGTRSSGSSVITSFEVTKN